jgi:hypothetical protein
MNHIIAVALTHDNIKFVHLTVKALIDFDIRTYNPMGALSVAEALDKVCIIDMTEKTVSVMHWRDFQQSYNGPYSSIGFNRVTKK